MSEYTPITGELREAMVRWGWCESDGTITVSSTPPNIDAEPFMTIVGSRFDHLCDAIDSIHAQLEQENERLRGEWDFWESTHVELPKDADDEYICAGDKLDGYGKTIEVVELRYGRSGWVLISRDGNAYADTYAFSHHQPDTWERIIEDACGGTASEQSLVARCKALAGDAE